jgi:hypothetical protein
LFRSSAQRWRLEFHGRHQSRSPRRPPGAREGGTITGSLLAEGTVSKTLIVTLGTPTGATLGSNTVNTLTINEPIATPPAVQFSTTSETVNASAGTFSLTVALSAASASAVSIPFTLGGTAKSGTD